MSQPLQGLLSRCPVCDAAGECFPDDAALKPRDAFAAQHRQTDHWRTLQAVSEGVASRLAASPHFQRAVRRERDAVKAHEAAAEQQDSAAAVLEGLAEKESDLDRAHMLQMASDFRTRAAAARQRAQLGRDRLRAEGVEPDAPG